MQIAQPTRILHAVLYLNSQCVLSGQSLDAQKDLFSAFLCRHLNYIKPVRVLGVVYKVGPDKVLEGQKRGKLTLAKLAVEH